MLPFVPTCWICIAAIVILTVISIILDDIFTITYNFSLGIIVFLITFGIAFIILAFAVDPTSIPVSKTKSARILAEQEQYVTYLNNEITDFDTAYNKAIDSPTIDNLNKEIHFYTNIQEQVRTLSENAGYKILLNESVVELNDIKLSKYDIFIDYDEKLIILSEKQ